MTDAARAKIIGRKRRECGALTEARTLPFHNRDPHIQRGDRVGQRQQFGIEEELLRARAAEGKQHLAAAIGLRADHGMHRRKTGPASDENLPCRALR